jgi:hypothetical protein
MSHGKPLRYLEGQASSAYQNGRYQEAAVYHLEAAQVARAQGAEDIAFSQAVTGAISWKLAGRPIRGLTVFVELLASIPPTASLLDVGMARKQVFRIICDYRPKVEYLRQRLQELRTDVEAGHLSRVDVEYLEGCLWDARGHWADALPFFERAIVGRGTSYGFMKFQIIAHAVRCCLRLGYREDAARWCDRLEITESYFTESGIAWHEACARLALYDRDDERLTEVVPSLTESVVGLQRPTWDRRAEVMLARTALLRTDLGDPWMRHHPARRVLTTRCRGTYEVCDRYERHLLLVDYQLASLRFALGLRPQEDYYARGNMGPVRLEGAGSFDCSDIAKRFQAVEHAIHTARRYARYLDGCFESSWRLEELRERVSRLNAVYSLRQEKHQEDLHARTSK